MRACGIHETAEDRAYREGYAAGRKAAAEEATRTREFWVEEGMRRQREKDEQERRRTEAAKHFRTETEDGKQLVVVDGYTYQWGGEPLSVGDHVMLPENWLSCLKHGRGPFPGVVTAIGSSYQGDLSEIVSRA